MAASMMKFDPPAARVIDGGGGGVIVLAAHWLTVLGYRCGVTDPGRCSYKSFVHHHLDMYTRFLDKWPRFGWWVEPQSDFMATPPQSPPLLGMFRERSDTVFDLNLQACIAECTATMRRPDGLR